MEGFDAALLLLARRQGRGGRQQQRRQQEDEEGEDDDQDAVAFVMGAVATLVKAELVALGKALGLPKPILARGDRPALLAALRSRVAATLDAAGPAVASGGGNGHYGAKPPDVGAKVRCKCIVVYATEDPHSCVC